MKVKIAYSSKSKVTEIVTDLKNQLKGFECSLVQFYSSSNIDVKELSKSLYKELGNVPMFGCTTSGELISGQMLEDNVVLLAMSEKIVADFKIEVLENISTDKSVVDKAFVSIGKHFGQNVCKLDFRNHIGFVLIDGLSLKEEAINERIVDLTNVTFIGGSAGDNMKFEKTYVFANGKTYTDAAVLCLMKSNVKFDILKTQSVKGLNKKLVVTKSDEKSRTVYEFNNEPALEEYARQIGIAPKDIDKSIIHSPLGIKIDEDYYIRSPIMTNKNEVIFACFLKQGVELELLRTKNIVEDTKRDLNKKIEEFGDVSVLINFNCAFRTMELKEANQIEEYGKIFKDIPTIGFSSYGESYIGHVNQTSIIVLFGE